MVWIPMGKKKVNVFKIVTDEHVDEHLVRDLLGEDYIEVELVEETTIDIKKPPTATVELELPEEYKKLLTDIPYYKKYHLPGGTLRKCVKAFEVGEKKFEAGVNFEFGQVKENGWIEIYLLVRNENPEEKQLYGYVTDSTYCNHWKKEYDVMLKYSVNKPPYDGEYIRVVVKS